MVGFGFWEKEEEKFLELFNTIKIEGRIVKEEVTAQNCKYSSSNWICTFNGAVFVTFIWTALVSRGGYIFFFCGLLYLVIFFIFPKVFIYQELKILDAVALMVNVVFKSVFFLKQEIILWRKAPEKLRKQRTNFHQRFESPESQASAEQPEMWTGLRWKTLQCFSRLKTAAACGKRRPEFPLQLSSFILQCCVYHTTKAFFS